METPQEREEHSVKDISIVNDKIACLETLV